MKLPNECFDKQNPAAFEAGGGEKDGVLLAVTATQIRSHPA